LAAVLLRRYWPILGILGLWQGIVTFGAVPAILVPPPAKVIADVTGNASLYLDATASTLELAILGLSAGMLLGLSLAVLGWLSPLLSWLLSPPAVTIRSVPIVAIIPIVARIVGYDEKTVITVAALIAFFPSFVFATAGLRATPTAARDLFAVLGARKLTTLLRLALPAAVPSILIAFRIAVAFMMLGAVTAQYLIGYTGLGAILVLAESELNEPRVWAVGILTTVVSLTAFLGSQRLEEWARVRWS